jgi:hypothetical protein
VLLPILSPLNFVFAKRVIFALIYTRALFLSNTAEERAEALDIIPDSLRILPAAQGHSRSRSHDAPVSSWYQTASNEYTAAIDERLVSLTGFCWWFLLSSYFYSLFGLLWFLVIENSFLAVHWSSA